MLDSGCAGFPLGYPSRKDIDINTKYTYLIQDRRPDASVCQPGRQNIPGNNPFPIANVNPGQQLHLTWQPDGHLDDSRPSTIEVHWTGIPGKQLITRTYQVVWWWKYDRNPAGEEYSTCFEMTVSGDGSAIQSREVDAKDHVVDSTAEAQIATQPQSEAEAAVVVVDNVSQQIQAPAATAVTVEAQIQPAVTPETLVPAPEAFVPAPAPEAFAPAPAPAPQAAVQIQDEAEQQQPPVPQQQVIIHTEPLQLAYMTMEPLSSPPSTAAAPESTIKSAELGGPNSSGVETLADLSTKADQPLNVVPNFSIIRESKNKDHEQVDGFSSDDIGSLAGDAVNDDEGKDTSPLPLVKPSELINTTLSENKSPGNGVNLTVTGAKSNATVPSGDKLNSNNTANAIIPESRPSSIDASSNKDKENSFNRNLASQTPNTIDSAAAVTTTKEFTTTAALVSIVLVTFTWMLV
ncbi:hypothetical protein BGZ96_008517 [Linnemannia gamsii]|uniref:Uncharacterized protein n=1 Tax=Linnemannia gamsii TaxID=64522 RepID=A0ABQ7KED6_9FUNG|nr:hypothetical protein BGZ96_008517 [Linnemannia gamsii]